MAGNRRDPNQDFAAGTLDLATGELLPTLQMLLTVRTSKLKLGHKLLDVFGQNMHQNQAARNGWKRFNGEPGA